MSFLDCLKDFNLKRPSDAVALTIHAFMLSMNFRLVGVTDDSPIEGFVLCSNTLSANLDPGDKLPPRWNDTDAYSFKYRHEQSSLTYLIKIVPMASKFTFMGMTTEVISQLFGLRFI
jgi:proteasome inhibitor subunit 1 (PI31)